MSRAGFVLTGGKSSRMGSDKAMLSYRGSPLVKWIADQVAAAAGNVTLVGAPERYAHLGYPMLADRDPQSGPLGGILTALAATRADWNLVVACDMPGLTVDFLQDLFDQAERSVCDCLLPRGPSGRPEPLCAVYNQRCLQPVSSAFDRGVRKVTSSLEGLRILWHPIATADLFHNANTPEEWAALEQAGQE